MTKFNVKTIDKKTIEVEGKLVNKPNPPKPPAWFVVFEKKIDEKFEKIDEKFEKIDQRLDKIDQRLDKMDQRFDNIVKLNNLKE